MSEPQIWTALGILAAAFVGVIAVTTQLMMRTITAQIGGLRNEMVVRFENVDQRFDGVDRRIDGVEQRIDKLDGRMDRIEGRIDALEKRVEDIDRDVQVLSKRVFPE